MNATTPATIATKKTTKTSLPPAYGDEHKTTLYALEKYAGDAGVITREVLEDDDFRQFLTANSEPDTNWIGGLGRVLNELTEWCYVLRIKAPSLSPESRPYYRITPAGTAAIAA